MCLSCEGRDILHVRSCCSNIDHMLLTRVDAATYLNQDSGLCVQMKKTAKNHGGSQHGKYKLELCQLFSALLVPWRTILSFWCLLFLEKLRIVFFHEWSQPLYWTGTVFAVCVFAFVHVCVCVRVWCVRGSGFCVCVSWLKPNWYFLILKLYYHICIYVALLSIQHGLGVLITTCNWCVCVSGFSVWDFEELCMG